MQLLILNVLARKTCAVQLHDTDNLAQVLSLPNFPSSFAAPAFQSDVVTWDTALDWALSTRDVAAIRLLIGSHYVDHLLKTNEQVDKVGGVHLWPGTPSHRLQRAAYTLSQSSRHPATRKYRVRQRRVAVSVHDEAACGHPCIAGQLLPPLIAFPGHSLILPPPPPSLLRPRWRRLPSC